LPLSKVLISRLVVTINTGPKDEPMQSPRFGYQALDGGWVLVEGVSPFANHRAIPFTRWGITGSATALAGGSIH
jgi:hypothetical protein